MTIHVLKPWDPPVGFPINVTSGSADFGKVLSPFTLGPVTGYGKVVSLTMENLWQYSKVYPAYDAGGVPNDAYWLWAVKGWLNQRAVRYPMGKGAKPVYSWWDGQPLDYVTARKTIYIPLYARAVQAYAREAFARLVAEIFNKDVTLYDYDGYDHRAENMNWFDVVNDTSRPMGHGFVLAMMLEGAVRPNGEHPF